MEVVLLLLPSLKEAVVSFFLYFRHLEGCIPSFLVKKIYFEPWRVEVRPFNSSRNLCRSHPKVLNSSLNQILNNITGQMTRCLTDNRDFDRRIWFVLPLRIEVLRDEGVPNDHKTVVSCLQCKGGVCSFGEEAGPVHESFSCFAALKVKHASTKNASSSVADKVSLLHSLIRINPVMWHNVYELEVQGRDGCG